MYSYGFYAVSTFFVIVRRFLSFKLIFLGWPHFDFVKKGPKKHCLYPNNIINLRENKQASKIDWACT